MDATTTPFVAMAGVAWTNRGEQACGGNGGILVLSVLRFIIPRTAAAGHTFKTVVASVVQRPESFAARTCTVQDKESNAIVVVVRRILCTGWTEVFGVLLGKFIIRGAPADQRSHSNTESCFVMKKYSKLAKYAIIVQPCGRSSKQRLHSINHH